MHVLICAPLASEDVADLLPEGAALPAGYLGAPFIATLARALLDLGHRVSIVSTASSLPVNRDEPVTVTRGLFTVSFVAARQHWLRFNGRHPGRIVDAFRLERRRMVAAIRTLRPDVVHAHWSYEFSQAAIASGLPRLVTCHDDPTAILRFIPGLYRGVRWLMARQVFATAGRFTTVSPYMKQRLAGRVNGPMAVIPNPLPLELPLPVEAGTVELPGLRVAMVANGWVKWKNPKVAFRAHALVRRVDSNARLTCFGSDFGPNEVAEQWARAQGLADGVEFVGRLPARELYSKLSSHQVLVHPALEESFGMVLAEAMALGLVVVAGRDSAAVPWVVGQEGSLVDARDPEAIARAVIELAREPSLRRARAARGRDSVINRFGPHSVAIAYVQEYQACMRSVVQGQHQYNTDV